MSRTTRRSFLKSAGGAFLGIQAMTYRTALLAQNKPSETVRVGSIGVGNQGRPNMNAIKKHVVAVCDVDRNRLAAAAASLEKASIKAATFGDYRKLLESKDIDAVVVTHARPLARAAHGHRACKAGKDVYCEKPLSLTVAEGRAMVKAAREQQADRADRQPAALGARSSGRPASWSATGTLGKLKHGEGRLARPNCEGPARRRCPTPTAGRARLRLLARPGAGAAVQRQPRPLHLPLLLGLLAAAS